MLKFLRYNARHTIFIPRGYDGKFWPQLNPISSSNRGKNGKRTFSFTEPLWLFRIRNRLFNFAGYHACPDNAHFRHKKDTWDIGPDGNRTCSYCGSIHYEDFKKIEQKVKDKVPGYAIEGTDKGYKFYVRQPGVRNAGEGAIKFYSWHFNK